MKTKFVYNIFLNSDEIINIFLNNFELLLNMTRKRKNRNIFIVHFLIVFRNKQLVKKDSKKKEKERTITFDQHLLQVIICKAKDKSNFLLIPTNLKKIQNSLRKATFHTTLAFLSL